MNITYGSLFAGVWNNDGRFDDVSDQPVPTRQLYRIAQLALAGWTFCGADEDVAGVNVELERYGNISSIGCDGFVTIWHQYDIVSCKGRIQMHCTLAEAIEHALEHDNEYQPAFGTTIHEADGSVVWDSSQDSRSGSGVS